MTWATIELSSDLQEYEKQSQVRKSKYTKYATYNIWIKLTYKLKTGRDAASAASFGWRVGLRPDLGEQDCRQGVAITVNVALCTRVASRSGSVYNNNNYVPSQIEIY